MLDELEQVTHVSLALLTAIARRLIGLTVNGDRCRRYERLALLFGVGTCDMSGLCERHIAIHRRVDRTNQ